MVNYNIEFIRNVWLPDVRKAYDADRRPIHTHRKQVQLLTISCLEQHVSSM